MWEIDVGNQAEGFLWAVALGAALCLFYDLIRAKRKVFSDTAISVFLGDVFFFFAAALATFTFFLVFTAGEIRAYVLFAAVIGFLICRLTLSRVFFYILCRCLTVFKRIRDKITAVLRWLAIKISEFLRFFKKILKKLLILLKKLLKNIARMLYTKKDKSAENPES